MSGVGCRKDRPCVLCDRLCLRYYDDWHEFLGGGICEFCRLSWNQMTVKRIGDEKQFAHLSDEEFDQLVSSIGETVMLEKLQRKLNREISRHVITHAKAPGDA